MVTVDNGVAVVDVVEVVVVVVTVDVKTVVNSHTYLARAAVF